MITEEQKRTYEEDGVVCLRDLFDEHWLEVAHQAIEHGRANPGPMYLDYSEDTKPRTYETDFWVWQDNDAMRRFIFESPAASAAGALMDVGSVMLVTDNWLVREAGAVNRAPWHHDGPYFDLDGRWCVLWMGLEPVGPGEGVVFLKGSHKWQRHFMPESFTGSGPKGALVAPYESTPDFSQELDHHEVLEFRLAPGDCLYFDRLTVHGAPNPAPAARSSRRFTFRLADGAARYRPRGPWTRDMTDFLEARHGLVEGGPYCCDLLPILWRSDRASSAT
ncbi:MAG: phytanoyl-CoA dioxygenase family protein [Planctomycetota bacterium]|jgi:ectoine hydroxylase-related dioxygenase (phytanoyl-CoA dioxygenase family)